MSLYTAVLLFVVVLQLVLLSEAASHAICKLRITRCAQRIRSCSSATRLSLTPTMSFPLRRGIW